ncbi:hypothetical protein GCM10022420_095430 [Streptomyces iranensis]|uniref:Antibiotic biosynthesis monooxygenase n=2 Tax=Streptomyces iranensis TaxID=576784 RepID=A0A061AE95_9ACTN|nr:antibiotic biosynthesis monooxygenase [Streptomyces iranensis]CDR18227.1 Antibiotic biosynthesis monooxygenase [Streptomyces iranensis]
MILRSWSARAPIGNTAAFLDTFKSSILPHMEGFPGYRGCYLLHREEDGQAHIQVLSLWNSPAAVEGFAGTDALTAVVSPAVADLMTDYDTQVRHEAVVLQTVTGHGQDPATPTQEDPS